MNKLLKGFFKFLFEVTPIGPILIGIGLFFGAIMLLHAAISNREAETTRENRIQCTDFCEYAVDVEDVAYQGRREGNVCFCGTQPNNLTHIVDTTTGDVMEIR